MPARLDPRTPVIVGVGQVNDTTTDAPEPVALLAEASRRAITDSGQGRLAAAVDSVRVVRLLSWRYADPGVLVAAEIGASPRHTSYSTEGGQTPQVMLDRAATDIQQGRADVVLLGGAEAWRTRTAYRRRGERPAWTRQADDLTPSEIEGTPLDMTNEIERERGVVMPVQVYPLFESALRYASGRSLEQHTDHIAGLWAEFSRVAATNPNAALPQALSEEFIAHAGPNNRMIGLPYTKLLNSNNSVNQAAALVLCSLGRAQSLGVADDRMIFPLAASEASDTPYVSNRGGLASSPAIRAAREALCEAAAMCMDDVRHIDIYSCFPSAVQVSAGELGVAVDRTLTVTGGMTFAGGPWNNYVSHSIATMVDVLRQDPGSLGLCTANGGLLTKHALGLYSSRPSAVGFRVARPEVPGGVSVRPVADSQVEGRTVIEAYTVMHDQGGEPETAIVTALLPSGSRTWRTSRRQDTLDAMVQEEFCGRPIALVPGGEFRVV
jgi:acetyl-CoA C-acetyltransferase